MQCCAKWKCLIHPFFHPFFHSAVNVVVKIDRKEKRTGGGGRGGGADEEEEEEDKSSLDSDDNDSDELSSDDEDLLNDNDDDGTNDLPSSARCVQSWSEYHPNYDSNIDYKYTVPRQKPNAKCSYTRFQVR